MARLIVATLIAASAFAADPPKPPASNTISVTVGQLFTLYNTDTMRKLAAQDLPIDVAWRVKRMIDVLNVEITRARTLQNTLFTDTNSTLNEAKTGRTLKPEFIDQFQKDLAKLQAEKIELSVAPLDLQSTDLSNIKLSVQDLYALEPLLKPEPKPEAKSSTSEHKSEGKK